MSLATAILVPVFGIVLMLAALTVSRLARAWRERDEGPAREEDPEIIALEDEKQRILATLRDLDHEHSLGKLSDSDHGGLKRHFEREAVRVIERLEKLRTERLPADPQPSERPS